MHTNTKLPLLWKLSLCCQDKHFLFMDASWIKWQIMLSFCVNIQSIVLETSSWYFFLSLSVHQFTTLFFRKTYNWGGSFLKKNLKNQLIFCGERRLHSFVKYVLVKVSLVVVTFLSPVHFSFWSYPKQINFFKEFFETFDILEIAFFSKMSLSSQDNRTGVRINVFK